MGAYLGKPKTEKFSGDEANDLVTCGVSCMQGWRVTQEDAHNSVLDFDKETSFFAVYDGHGGHEVAAYCAQHLPNFLRQTESYKKGDMVEALKEAYLGFDATLTLPEIINVLKDIAGKKSDDGSGTDDEDNVQDLNVQDLRAEASMPIEQVIAKYQSDVRSSSRKAESSGGASSSGAGCSSTSDRCAGSSASSSGSKTKVEVGPSSSSTVCHSNSSNNDQVSSSSCVGEGSTSSSSDVNKDHIPDTPSANVDVDSSDDVQNSDTAVISGSESVSKQNGEVDSSEKKEVNGDISHEVKEEENGGKGDAVSSSCKEEIASNGPGPAESQTSAKGKGKAKDKSPRPDPIVPGAPSNKDTKEQSRQLPRRVLNQIMKLREKYGDDSDETDDEDDDDDTCFFDTSFDDDEEDDEIDDEEEEDDDDEDDDDEEEEEEEETTDEEDDEFTMTMADGPGSESGCTAVVALLKGRDLYVANAGDSRCVVCRNGIAIDMSLDHKPEDAPERERIISAGGRISCDGRVNGGLNLSRAIGDHAYKQSKELSATEQMITALPDVRTLRINPETDEFMVLACDGIWNFLSSQEVVDFVQKRLKSDDVKISKICEELFDHCLAPDTLGDGTGCDNMTAVIVRFRPELAKASSHLTNDSVFASPISNDVKEENSSGKAAEAEAEAKPKIESNSENKNEIGECANEEVTSSNPLKRPHPQSNEEESAVSSDSPHSQEKRVKAETSESSSLDSEAVAVQV